MADTLISRFLSSFLLKFSKNKLTFCPKPRTIHELNTELKMSDGYKVTLTGLSKNKGVIWINWDGINTHILISDLDEESQLKVNALLMEANKK